jgi:hypothetical protein
VPEIPTTAGIILAFFPGIMLHGRESKSAPDPAQQEIKVSTDV